MSVGRSEHEGEVLHVDGISFLSTAVVARTYCVEESFVEEILAFDLLGEALQRGGHRYIATTMLGRVSEIVRLHVQLGVNLEGITVLLAQRSG